MKSHATLWTPVARNAHLAPKVIGKRRRNFAARNPPGLFPEQRGQVPHLLQEILFFPVPRSLATNEN
jgi:hypothetical protein